MFESKRKKFTQTLEWLIFETLRLASRWPVIFIVLDHRLQKNVLEAESIKPQS